MFEFKPTFELNTGDLNKIHTGSGVHLERDVTISLNLLDPELNAIKTDSDLINNPLTDTISFDILNSKGEIVYPNYKSGSTSRTLTLTEIENASIFGSYQKDFGFQSTISNKINLKKFISQYYVYGNIPEVDLISTIVFDGGPNRPPIIDPYLGVIDGGNEIQTGEILLKIVLINSFLYIRMIRYDIYVSTEDNIVVWDDPNARRYNPFYLYSQAIENYQQASTLIIKPIGLYYNTPYYFTVVPYSTMGSGTHIKFGPKIFTKPADDNVPLVITANQFQVGSGNNSVNLSVIEGVTTLQPNVNTTIDILNTGEYNTILYTSQFKTGNSNSHISYISSELKLVYGGSGSDTLLESPITNSGQLFYSVSEGANGTRLLQVSGAPPYSTYLIYKTSL